ncbi:hydrolase [Sinimarinibacterium flocculans]|uniref:Glutamate carboxypeptidase n=1 Tax=Sinimarinibacterium flocculans TaxID=985250 RepID=A0A318EGA6_9GAMM|nr:hydrolase [Sinimarinibacterium flocculans]PXV67239.1 glutamate carboxypeptidase [Sinimarinibacterium flocculans]
MREEFAPFLQWIDAQLPEMRDSLVQLSDQNSGSFNAAGVRAVGERLRARFAPLGCTHEWIELPTFVSTADDGRPREHPIGPALRLRQRPDAPLQVFLGGHLDTVFGPDHPFQKTRPDGDDGLHGPGVADLKGGLLVMWAALAALERSPWRERIGWEVLLNPDEEIGSAGSDPLLRAAAGRNRFGLIYEPSFPDGGLASGRKGSGNFDVIVHGRAAHAGRNPEEGRNALRAAADAIRAIDSLNGSRDGVTLNIGYAHGGGPLNVVPDLAVFKLNVRTTIPDDQCWVQEQLDRILIDARRDGIRFELRGGFTRPPKIVDARAQTLIDWLGDCGRALGTPLAFKPTGGCCDGNNLAAHGLPNVDNLGVVGRDIHSDAERMRVSSLTERAKISALLLLRCASGELEWH